ncbi:hypothetical protein K8I61_09580 [bacterium]|nr:hypothetical protein [bacterium]
MGKIDFARAFTRGWEAFTKNILNLVIGYLIFLVLCMTVVLAPIAWAGMTRMALRAVRGEPTSVNDVFSGFSDFGRYFLGGIIAFAMIIVGVLMCGVGVIPVGGLLLFFFPYMVDRNAGTTDAFSANWAYFQTDWLMAIALSFVTGLMVSLSSSVLLGILIAGPIQMTVVLAAYEDVFGTAAAPTAMAPPAAQPIA